MAAVTCTEVEKVASIPSEIAEVDGFSFLGIEAVATDKAAHQLQHTSALEVASKVATSASVAVGAMNNCQNCVYVRRVCGNGVCMGREIPGANNDGGHIRCAACLRPHPRVRVFAHRQAGSRFGSLWPHSLWLRSLRPHASLCAKQRRPRVGGARAHQLSHAHMHRQWPRFHTLTLFTSPQHKRMIRFPHA